MMAEVQLQMSVLAQVHFLKFPFQLCLLLSSAYCSSNNTSCWDLYCAQTSATSHKTLWFTFGSLQRKYEPLCCVDLDGRNRNRQIIATKSW